ncbi:hypothetical protein CC2G_002954 [Coprinopsis cinerea AmutBmut pab1-1]|nr:hypothetical protein CC2G_002954 [Coprinopsis cinerea AmutBmut pab1-1]
MIPAYSDKRRLRDSVRDIQRKDFKGGVDFNGKYTVYFNRSPSTNQEISGVMYEYNEKEVLLPTGQRYIHSVVGQSEFKLVVTMLQSLVKDIHKANSLEMDFSFKRVYGEMNEWDVAGFLPDRNKRVTFAHLYCNRATKEAFTTLFNELWRVIREVTGSVLKFKVFFPEDPAALLLCIRLDAEAPQAQGLAASLVTYQALYVKEPPKDLPKDPMDLLLHVLKICYVHFERNISKLEAELTHDELQRLKGFKGLSSQQEIDDWHTFASGLSGARSKAWYQHKKAHPWILPACNKFLSPINDEDWDLTPTNTNLVEGGHAEVNRETDTGLPLLLAIRSAQEYDRKVAHNMELSRKNAISENRWNTAKHREAANIARRKSQHKKLTTKNAHLQEYFDLQERLHALNLQRTESLERSKALEGNISLLDTEYNAGGDQGVKEKIKLRKKDLAHELDKRRVIRGDSDRIRTQMEALKTGPLQNIHIPKERPDRNRDGHVGGQSGEEGEHSGSAVHRAGQANASHTLLPAAVANLQTHPDDDTDSSSQTQSITVHPMDIPDGLGEIDMDGEGGMVGFDNRIGQSSASGLDLLSTSSFEDPFLQFDFSTFDTFLHDLNANPPEIPPNIYSPPTDLLSRPVSSDFDGTTYALPPLPPFPPSSPVPSLLPLHEPGSHAHAVPPQDDSHVSATHPVQSSLDPSGSLEHQPKKRKRKLQNIGPVRQSNRARKQVDFSVKLVADGKASPKGDNRRRPRWEEVPSDDDL